MREGDLIIPRIWTKVEIATYHVNLNTIYLRRILLSTLCPLIRKAVEINGREDPSNYGAICDVRSIVEIRNI